MLLNQRVNFVNKILNKTKHQRIKASTIFKNEDGAIDLASIMVGIIVIGLIGGVVASTVFAVIPWTQDNAAKQQLDSITAAESAYMGLSSADPSPLPTGLAMNSFANSSELETAGLLNTNPRYCVTTANTGPKSFEAFSVSSSGNIWTSTANATKPVLFTGTLPDDCQFIIANTTPSPTVTATPSSTPTASPTPPPAPVYTSIRYHTFEGASTPDMTYFSLVYSSDYIGNSNSDGIVGSSALYAQTMSSGNVSGNPTKIRYSPRMSLVIGQKYRATFLTKLNTSTTAVAATTGTYTSTTTSAAGKNTVTLEFTPTTANQSIIITATGPGQYNRPVLIVDEFKLDQVD